VPRSADVWSVYATTCEDLNAPCGQRPHGRRCSAASHRPDASHRQAQVAEARRNEVTRSRFRSGGLEGGDEPDAACQEFDVHLQEVVTGAGGRQLQKVEADAPPPPRRDRERSGLIMTSRSVLIAGHDSSCPVPTGDLDDRC
jgi:hypothetical protein